MGLRDSGGHAVRHQIRRHRADGVLGSRGSPEEARGGGLRSVDSGRRNLIDSGLGDGTVAGSHLGGQDLLESSLLGNLFNTLEVLRKLIKVSIRSLCCMALYI